LSFPFFPASCECLWERCHVSDAPDATGLGRYRTWRSKFSGFCCWRSAVSRRCASSHRKRSGSGFCSVMADGGEPRGSVEWLSAVELGTDPSDRAWTRSVARTASRWRRGVASRTLVPADSVTFGDRSGEAWPVTSPSTRCVRAHDAMPNGVAAAHKAFRGLRVDVLSPAAAVGHPADGGARRFGRQA
jgi:hypothetical protein